jgi:branched-chain amino acid transport system ATP-binding protein
MLAVEGLSKSFGGVAAIQDVSLKFAPGSLTAIIGPNGAGKTTFFNLISGAIRPDKGRVTLAGEDIVGLPPAQIARRGIARSFQIASIFPSLTIEAILTATVQAHLRQAERIMRRFPLPECRERAFAAMDMLGLAACWHLRCHREGQGPPGVMAEAMKTGSFPAYPVKIGKEKLESHG